MNRNEEREIAAKKAANCVHAKLGFTREIKSDVAVVLGTGWGAAIYLKDELVISLSEIHGFECLQDMAQVKGHEK